MRLAPLAVAIALLGACSGADADRPDFTTRDSAGVEIVESSGPAWPEGEAWTVAADPVLQVGVVEGAPEYQFDGIAGAILLEGGGLAIADRGSREIRLYDEEGRHVRSLGGPGEGPGELQALQWIGARGDSILAWDPRAKRLTVFTLAGELVGSVTVQALATAWSPVAIGPLDDGTLIVTPGDSPAAMFAAPEGRYRGEWTYMAVSGDGSVVDTIATLPSGERWLTKRDNGFSAVEVAFGRETHAATAGDVMLAGDGEAYEVIGYAPDGSVDRVVRRMFEPQPVTDADIAAEVERIAGSFPEAPSAREGMQASLDRMEPRRSLPAFTDVLTDDGGNLWVREAHLPDDPRQTWSVFDPSGRWLGTLEVPADLRVRHVAGDRMVGTWSDELDVEYARVHRILKP